MTKFDQLIKIVKKLRSPDGCDWDKKQTHESLMPYLLEEVYEVIEAIENKDFDLLKEELGDLLLHVIFQADLAEDSNNFSIEDSIDGVNKKLTSRHSHIFDSKNNTSWTEGSWESQKQKEKKRDSVLDGVPSSLPALLKSRRIQEKAASVGFDWKHNSEVLKKVDEEVTELKDAIKQNYGIEDEFGDVLFTLVNLSRHLDIDPEKALRLSTKKFSHRFKKIEKKLRNENIKISDLSIDELDIIWEKNKRGSK
jgi:tetrapyrrole methylase family protein / MazG family protein